MSVVYERHLALRVPYELGYATEPVAPEWVLGRAKAWLDAYAPGGSNGTRVITDRGQWAAVGGYPLPMSVWGNVDRARGVDYQDQPRAGTPEDPFLLFLDLGQLRIARGFAESVVGHEVTHLRFKTLGHGQRFFQRVQEGIFALGDARAQAYAPTVASVLQICAPHLTEMVDSPH